MQRQAAFIFNDDGPMLIDVVVRPSQTQPGRLKLGFVVELDKSPKLIDPAGGEHPTPVELDGETIMLGDEFRFEMN